MILDISRHKFYEALITLLAFTTIAVVRAFMLSDELLLMANNAAMPMAQSIMLWAANHPTITALAVIPIYMNTVLSLARATVRTALYPQSSMAAISLIALALLGTTLTPSYPIAMLIALLMAQCLARLLYCFGPNSHYHKLFTAMLAVGIVPLLDGAMAIISLLILTIVILQRGTARESIIATAGVLLPTFVCSYIEWLLGRAFTDTPLHIWEMINTLDTGSLMEYLTLPRLVFLGYMLFLYLTCATYYFGNQLTLSNSARSAWATLHIITIASIGLTAAIPSAAPSTLCCATIAISAMLPLLYQRIGDAWSAIAYIAFIALSNYCLWG